LAYLVFIDTNVFLDFYRVTGRQGELSILEHVDHNHDRLITTSQVEMEFKKNRPNVMLECYRGLRNPQPGGLQLPAYLARSKQSSGLDTCRRKIESQLTTLRNRVSNAFSRPTAYDPVYRVAQRLFRDHTAYNLSRAMQERFSIRRLARKRWLLGYPPRKPGDTSIGDAINWEWIVSCASRSACDVVIVSRDTDYGLQLGDQSVLNDWLAQEFRDRVGKRRKALLTDRLAEGLKLASIKVKKDEEAAEQRFLKGRADEVLASVQQFPAAAIDVSRWAAAAISFEPALPSVLAYLAKYASSFPWPYPPKKSKKPETPDKPD
jgi:hypothetical protein